MDLKQRLTELHALQVAWWNTPLQEEFSVAADLLRNSTEYEELSLALKVLRIAGQALSAALLTELEAFIGEVPQRTLTLDGAPLPDPTVHRSLSWADLRWTAFEVSLSARWIDPERLVKFLLNFANSSDEDVQIHPEVNAPSWIAGDQRHDRLTFIKSFLPGARTQAQMTLTFLAAVDQNRAGQDEEVHVQPQLVMVNHFSSWPDEVLLEKKALLLQVLGNVLMPSLDDHPGGNAPVSRSWKPRGRRRHPEMVRWLRRGENIRASGAVPAMRASAIALLKRLYALGADSQVLPTLFDLANRRLPFKDDATKRMVEGETLGVLEFLGEQVALVDLRQLSAIANFAYNDCYRQGAPSIASAALRLRDAIYRRSSFSIYAELFNGPDEAWETLHLKPEETGPVAGGGWTIQEAIVDINDSIQSLWRDVLEYVNGEVPAPYAKEDRAIQRFIADIHESNQTVWRERILEIVAAAPSDWQATGNLVRFLQTVGKERPALALELLKDDERMRRFLVNLFDCLWLSNQRNVAVGLVTQWIKERRNLVEIGYSLNRNETPELALLKRLLVEARRLEPTAD